MAKFGNPKAPLGVHLIDLASLLEDEHKLSDIQELFKFLSDFISEVVYQGGELDSTFDGGILYTIKDHHCDWDDKTITEHDLNIQTCGDDSESHAQLFDHMCPCERLEDESVPEKVEYKN